MALAMSSRWTNWAGGSSSGARTPAPPARARANHDEPVLGQAGDRPQHGHRAVLPFVGPVDDQLLDLGVADRVGEVGHGRRGASSVMGTGLFGQAPYTVAVESTTRWRTPPAVAASSTRRVTAVSSVPGRRRTALAANGEVDNGVDRAVAGELGQLDRASGRRRSTGRCSTFGWPTAAGRRSRVTTASTSGASASSATTRRPMAPEAPVTTTTLRRGSPPRSHFARRWDRHPARVD